jgi:hypothetical protein
MKSRKLHWTVPNDWMEREDEAIAERVINQGKENLLDLKKAFQAGSLKAVHHVKWWGSRCFDNGGMQGRVNK